MIKLIVCMKQVPMVSELPWDSKTGTLKRTLADGMMNPACKHALEAALQIKQIHGGTIAALTMGPLSAEEILREAIAMGADRGILISDKRLAGSDTYVTSYTLAKAIETVCPDFDLILCGCHTSDSETGQVGPQLSEELNIPGVAYVEHLELINRSIQIQRTSDNHLETLEMDLPALITLSTSHYCPRYTSLEGLQLAFENADISIFNGDDLGIDPKQIGVKGSPTRIVKVYSPMTKKKNVVLTGSTKKILDQLYDQFGDRISGIIGKDLQTHYHDE